MDDIRLVTPLPQHKDSALDYVREHLDVGEEELHGAALLEQADDYEAWRKQVLLDADEATVRPGWVPASTFFAVRQSDGRIVGMINVRHRLNDFLAGYGGHIGYGVRPSERQKGYATRMLAMALDYCRALNLDRVMVACNKGNQASANTIRKHNGQLEREFLYTDGNIVQIYYINLR